jgi:hypothetical protein
MSSPPASRSAPRCLLHAAAASSLVAVLLGLAACGDDDGGGGEPKKLQIEATGGGKSVQLKAPKSADGGLVEISFKNSARDAQEAQLVRVEGNHSVEELLKVFATDGGPIPGWLRGGGGVGETKPGQTRSVTQRLPEGKYYVVDSNVEGEPATAPLTVEGGDGGELPETDAGITARDYSFSTTGLKPGSNEVRFANSGKELHHLIALPINKGATLEDVKKAFREEEPSGPPPFDEKGAVGTAVLDTGTSQVTDLTLSKGKYALVCFIQDRKGGPPHAVKGMVSEADIR